MSVDRPAAVGAPAKPRLVYIITAAVSAWGLLRGQLRYMRECGFDVTLISGSGNLLDEVARREGVRVLPVDMRRPPDPWRDARALAQLVLVLWRLRPHIVHYSTPKASLLGSIASAAVGTPVRLHTLRGLRCDGFDGIKGTWLRSLERVSCVGAHRVYCISESLRDRARVLGLAPACQLRVLGSGSSNGVDSAVFSRSPEVMAAAVGLRTALGLPSGVPVIGFVGRFVRDKGIVELIHAYRELRHAFPDLRLLLVGDFESYDAIPGDVRAAILEDRMVLRAGFLQQPAPAYALMDVLAFPTHREGFGNVAAEAAAMEVPVVATRVTGCVDAVVDGVTGTLVPPRDPTALADALARYLRDPELRRAHGAAGRERIVREFQPIRIWEALRREYLELLESRGLPLPTSPARPDSGGNDAAG